MKWICVWLRLWFAADGQPTANELDSELAGNGDNEDISSVIQIYRGPLASAKWASSLLCPTRI